MRNQDQKGIKKQLRDGSIVGIIGMVFAIPLFLFFGRAGVGVWFLSAVILSIVIYYSLGDQMKPADDSLSTNENVAQMLEQGGVSEGYNEKKLETLVNSARGTSINKGSLLSRISPTKDKFLIDYLDDGEQPHYLIKGGTIDVEGGGDSSSLYGNDRSRSISTLGGAGIGCYTIITNKRVYSIVQQVTGNDERNIQYDAITGVDLDTGVANIRLTIHTKGRTYHISGFQNKKEECRNAVDYILKMKNNRSINNPPDSMSLDHIEELERLQELRERNALTEGEFQRLKKELLE